MHEVWRQAAMDDAPQFYGALFSDKPSQGVGLSRNCAITILPDALWHLVSLRLPVQGECLVEGCDYQEPRRLLFYSDLIVHLNNHHHWDWLDFANKFPLIKES